MTRQQALYRRLITRSGCLAKATGVIPAVARLSFRPWNPKIDGTASKDRLYRSVGRFYAAGFDFKGIAGARLVSTSVTLLSIVINILSLFLSIYLSISGQFFAKVKRRKSSEILRV